MPRTISKKILQDASVDALREAFHDKSRTIKTISIRTETYADLKKICQEEGWKLNGLIDTALASLVKAYRNQKAEK